MFDDISYLFPHLHRWSTKGFQSFIESGVFSDVVEVSKSADGKLSKKLSDQIFHFHKTAGRCQESVVSGGVTLTQLKRLLDEVPVKTHGDIAKFIRFFQQWCFIAGWWDTNTMAWDVRDEWREKMGLKRLNPVLKNPETGACVTFKKLGKQIVENYPPATYRYATLGEVSGTNVPEGEVGSVLVFFEDTWFLSHKYPLCGRYVIKVFQDGFVWNANRSPNDQPQAYVALVKF